MTSRSHLVFDEINFDQSGRSDFFLKKNRRDLIGAKHTPGCAFLFFLQEKTVTHCNACALWPQHKRVYVVLQRCKNCAGCKYRSGLLFLCAPLFPCCFFFSIYFFFSTKMMLLFFTIVSCWHFGCVCLRAGFVFVHGTCCCWLFYCLQERFLDCRLFSLCFSCLLNFFNTIIELFSFLNILLLCYLV